MLRVPGPPNDASAAVMTEAEELESQTNCGYRYGGPGFGAGATGTTAYSTTWDFVCDRDAHHSNHFIHAGSPLRGY